MEPRTRPSIAGALQEIARLGGGTVESYPDDMDGRRVSSSFERHGFERVRPIGKNRWVVRKVVS